MLKRVEGGLTYAQTFDAENRLITVAVGGQTTQFIYDGDGNLVKNINPNGSKTLYPSTTPQTAAAPLRAGMGGIYEVDKTSGGSVTRTVTYCTLIQKRLKINGHDSKYPQGNCEQEHQSNYQQRKSALISFRQNIVPAADHENRYRADGGK